MLNTIHEYCLRHPFANGVFLVGAAHRESIRTKSREDRATGAGSIEWE